MANIKNDSENSKQPKAGFFVPAQQANEIPMADIGLDFRKAKRLQHLGIDYQESEQDKLKEELTRRAFNSIRLKITDDEEEVSKQFVNRYTFTVKMKNFDAEAIGKVVYAFNKKHRITFSWLLTPLGNDLYEITVK